MSDQPRPTADSPDLADLSKLIIRIAERSQRLVTNSIRLQMKSGCLLEIDPPNVGEAFMEMSAHMMAVPANMVQSHLNLWHDYLTLWNNSAQRILGRNTAPIIEAGPDDQRFQDDAWNEHQSFDFLKQFYLLTSRWMLSSVREVDGLHKKTADKVDFYTRQFVDALSPSNFVMTNTEVIRTTLKSGGKNLLTGFENFLANWEKGDGKLKIKMVDPGVFEVGVNVATTPGKVVFRNDLMELL